MLVLTRKSKQSIKIGDDVEITVLSIAGGQVRIGISAPLEISVVRTEAPHEIDDEQTLEPPNAKVRADVEEALGKINIRRS
ncbi:MAG: carbon storage regulator CsrA [Actinomycetota bacterium]